MYLRYTREVEKVRQNVQEYLKIAERKYLLRKTNKTIVSIARACEVTPGAIGHVIRGDRRSPHLRSKIAKETGIPYQLLWGEEEKIEEGR